jgi:hypothetical protein
MEEANVQYVDSPVTVRHKSLRHFSATPGELRKELISDMRRYPWPILRLDGAVQDWWILPRNKLRLHGLVDFPSRR